MTMQMYIIQAYQDMTSFIMIVNKAVKGKRINDTYPISQVSAKDVTRM